MKSTERFSDRVASYVRARPGYPAAMVQFLARELELAPGAVIGDLGSGTGLSAEPFLRAGFTVIGVEPNEPMRAAGDEYLAEFTQDGRFRSVAGTAEATTLPPHSVDFIIAGQAFHWFDVPKARAEAQRILRPASGAGGSGQRAALIWNDRVATGSALAVGYERLLEEFGVDYAQIKHRHALEPSVDGFFGSSPETRAWRESRFDNPTALDWDTLVERLNSASYVPKRDAPTYAPMLARLRQLFDDSARDGRVRMDYTTRVFHGALVG